MPVAPFRPAAWPLAGFHTLQDGRVRTRYPIRFLRYWFVRMLLETLHARLGRPLCVLEVGIGDGRMPRFLDGPRLDGERSSLPPWIARWDGLDVQADESVLARSGYSSFIKADLERPFELARRQYDAVVLLHVLEHLFAPEDALARLLAALRVEGALIGGSPTMPEPLARLYEPLLRRRYRHVWHDVHAHRHLSVISPARLRRFAKAQGLRADFISGAFLLRATNLFLENHAAWMRANVLWGQAFPALGGEVYFSLSKPGEV